ncbi:MAG: UDP-N-acetylmuramate dehydrogenase [Dehalococcoidia bacterium]
MISLPAGLLKRLEKIGPVRLHEPLARHVTFGVGGPADAYLVARSRDELKEAFVAGAEHGAQTLILGAGSNILVGDGGFRGLVVENEATAIDGPTPAEDDSAGLVRVDSGVSFASLARRMCRAGWAGIEWAVGIPGSLGGAVVHNAGAYEGCLADVLIDAEIADGHGAQESWNRERLGFSYRNSVFARGQIEPSVVLGVQLLLRRGDAGELMAKVAAYDRDRTGAQPPGRNCGSVFKNPAGHSSWQLIDAVELRGHRIGNAQISDKHANFILNLGDARAADVKGLIDLAQQRVRDQFGVELETEVNLVGEGF